MMSAAPHGGAAVPLREHRSAAHGQLRGSTPHFPGAHAVPPFPASSAAKDALWRLAVRLVAYPVTFRSALEGAAFSSSAAFLAYYAIAPDIGPLDLYLKYLFAASSVICLIFLIVARQVVCLSPGFLAGPLLLSIAGAISFAYGAARGANTYSSALIPLVIVAVPLFVPFANSRTNGRRIVSYLTLLFGTAATFHVVWQVVGYVLGIKELLDQGPVQTAVAPRYFAAANVVLFFMILAGLSRRNWLLALALALAVISLVLRPSSTLAFTSGFAILTIIAHRLRFRRQLRMTISALVIGLIACNLAILSSGNVARAVYAIEPYIKSDMLHSKSNNDFRLAVLAAARAEMAESSIWIGDAFVADMDVSITRYLSWYDRTEAPIHSDFLTFMLQGGLIGFALFAGLFLGLAKLCCKGARLAHAAGRFADETFFDAVLAIDFVFCVYISFNPIMQMLPCIIPFLTVVPLAVFLARETPGSVRSRAPLGRALGATSKGPVEGFRSRR